MRRLSLVVLGAVTSALLAGCSGGQEPTPEPSPTPEPATSAQPSVPPAPEPANAGPCPYLDTDEVARTNGQGVGEVKTSAEEPHPACFFYRPDGDLQLTVRVYTGEPAVAVALVDETAPVDTSSPADEPAGWEGGYETTDEGSVYAVAKDGNAVVVTTNQQQSIKARTVATDTITRLGL